MAEFPLELIDKKIKSDPDMLQLAKDDPIEFDSKVMQIYKEFGYKPDGSPIPVMQQAAARISKRTGLPEGLVQAGMALPIPLATTAISAAAGTAAGGPGAGTALGAMFGSLSGEEINARLGITQPLTPSEQAIALGAPLIGPLASRLKQVGKGLVQRLPGAQVGIHELAGETLEASLKKIRVTDLDVQAARKLVANAPDVRMDLPGLKALLHQETASVGKRIEFPGSEAYIKTLNKFIEELSHGPVSMKKVLEWERGANLAKVTNPTEVWGKMAGTIIGDMETAVTNPKISAASQGKIKESLEAFRMLVQMSRKYNADEALDGILKRVITPLADDTSLLQFNKKQFVKELKNNQALHGAWSTKEIADIQDAIEGIGHISSKATPSLLQKFAPGTALATGGALIGGLQVGAVISSVVIAKEGIREGVSTDAGRKIIKYLSKQGQGKLSIADLNTMLGQITAAAGVGAAAVSKAISPFHPFPTEE